MKVYPIRTKKVRDKIELILKSKSKRNYLLWVLGTNTGFRVGDLLKLTVKDVKGAFISAKETKTEKRRNIKINKKLKEVIKEYIRGLKDSDVLFPSRVGVNRAISPRQAQYIIKELTEKIGVEENINTHSMRKTFAYNLYQVTGQNIGLVMEALNHTREIITLRYLCLIEEQLDNAVDKLAYI